MVDLQKFNINSYVYFKPNALGKKIYDDFYKSLVWARTLTVDENGYAHLQLHNFIAIYGQAICSVYTEAAKPFTSYDIYFSTKDLQEIDQ